MSTTDMDVEPLPDTLTTIQLSQERIEAKLDRLLADIELFKTAAPKIAAELNNSVIGKMLARAIGIPN